MIMELGYGGWCIPERRPCLGGFSARYDKGQESVRDDESASFIPVQRTGLETALEMFTQQGRIGSGQESFAGDRVAPFGDIQNQALSPESLKGFLDTFSANRDIPFFGETGDALSGILRGETGAEQITPERAEQVFQQTRVDPRLREFERFTKPLIEEQFAGPNFQSSARAREVGLAGERVGEDLGDERAGFLFDIENVNRQLEEAKAGRTLSAIPTGFQAGGIPEQIAGARLAGRTGIFDFASAQQSQAQREIQAEREIFQEAQRFMDPEDLSALMGFLGLNFQTSSLDIDAPSSFQAGSQKVGSAVGSGISAGLGAALGG
jgi:hypothetical protein